MKLDARQRWLVLGGLLTATLAAAAWVRDGGQDETPDSVRTVDRPGDTTRSRPVREQRTRQLVASEMPRVRLDKLDTRSLGNSTRDPFAVPRPEVTEQVAPEPKPLVVVRAAPPPPPPPSAPPLPFRYMGKMVSADGVSVFLTQGDRNLVVREGDTVGARYRVENITDTSISLTYLPLEQRQILNFGQRE